MFTMRGTTLASISMVEDNVETCCTSYHAW